MMMKLMKYAKLRSFLFVMLFLTAFATQAAEILVGGAASLSNAFKEIAAQYEAGHPQDRVVLSFAASDVLQRQIANGAPIDIFASADQVAMDKAVQAGTIVDGSRHDFARNTLVLIVPAQDQRIAQLEDLLQSGVKRIAIGNPETVPAGRYAQAALTRAGQWDHLADKRILGQNVRQVLDYVVRGEVDAGIVFATDAALAPERLRVVQTLDLPQEILYPVALVARENRPEQAAQLLAYIRSTDGQAVLARYGFGRP